MRKQLDPRIPILITNNAKKNHRSFIVLVGDKGRDQVRQVQCSSPSAVDWDGPDCQPPLLTFSSSRIGAAVRAMVLQERSWVHDVSEHCTVVEPNRLMSKTRHRKKREAKIKRDVKRGIREPNEQNPFEIFVTVTDIRYTYYKESHKILGNTYGMCVLQDFEAITPNLLARTIETVEGGGLVVLLLKTMASLRQLYTMAMVSIVAT